MILQDTDILAFRQKILNWYDGHKRDLPWRAMNGVLQDPYKVWLSEIMLQQTTVSAVIPYFFKFTSLWPNVFALAGAESETLMSEWAGLGYYARARNLHACAQKIVNDFGGVFPKEEKILRSLPGVGEYTAAAIRSIAFDLPSTVVDGNIERIMARYFAIQTPLPQGKIDIKKKAEFLSGKNDVRCGDYAQALMDLGATICTPKSPKCNLCPISDVCLAKTSGKQENFPYKVKKQASPQKVGYVYFISDSEGRILLEKRKDSGLLGGMIGLPTSDWLIDKKDHPDFIKKQFSISYLDYEIKHTFTHFNLFLIPCIVNVLDNYTFPNNFFWAHKNEFIQQRFPTVFKKAQIIFRENLSKPLS